MEAEELKSPFEAIKQTDEAGNEWWNSRQLAKTMGYTKYWNFERLIDKVAHAMQVERGLDRNGHFCEIEEMAQLGNGTTRRVTSVLLSRVACMGIACNADQRKPMVKMARDYFQGALKGKELAKGLEGNVLIYRSSTGRVNVSVLFNQDTFWLSQQRMAGLFGVTNADISYHLKQIESNGELHLSDCIKKILIPSEQWDEQGVTLYNLDVVIAVGYRVNSYEATQFRIWATKVLKEFIVKGFVMDDERLKGKTIFGEDYFEELLDRIREIRTSERRYYQKITDIYAECSYDYDKNSETTRLFYKTVQNMMHYAVTHQTAAEIVYDRANAEKPYMGLTTWKNAPDGRIRKSDVTIAKNYLSEKEVHSLELLSTAFVDIAELKAERQQLMSMKDWKEQLVKFLSINDHDILPDAGSISHEQAEEKAWGEYEKYRVIQDQTFLSDFDQLLNELK
ncbi:MAG: virulence RhuM family protein [Prevotellaceae bacterium]|nr:virulence RhuM family protein [Prevotellaceae bacterium]